MPHSGRLLQPLQEAREPSDGDGDRRRPGHRRDQDAGTRGGDRHALLGTNTTSLW